MKGSRFYVLAGIFAITVTVALVLVYGGFLENSNDVAGIEGPAPAIDSITNPALDTASARAALPNGIGNTANPSEGIQVHGHWTIEIRDPDGTLVSHREFDNALTTDAGENLLPDLFLSGFSPGIWLIFLDPASTLIDPLDYSGSPCLDGSSLPARCFITELQTGSPPPNSFGGLTATTTGIPFLRLSGAITAAQAGDIGVVATHINSCNPFTTTPIACRGEASDVGQDRPFTRTSLVPAEAIQAGQQAQITVDISFN